MSIRDFFQTYLNKLSFFQTCGFLFPQCTTNFFLCLLLVTLMSECWRTVCWKPFRSKTNGQQDLTGESFDITGVLFILLPLTCSYSYCCMVLLCRLMPIQQCELVLVHIYPQGEETLVSDRQKKEVASFSSFLL